jgi:hypothetical protein
MYYAVFFSLIINVLSLLSIAWLLESSCPDFIRTSISYPLCSMGQIATLTLHDTLVVLASSLGRPVILIFFWYFLPVTGFRTTSWHPVIRP